MNKKTKVKQKSVFENIYMISNKYHFESISSALAIITFIGTFLSLIIMVIHYIFYIILISKYGINDKSLFSFNLNQFLILLIHALWIIAIYIINHKIHQNNSLSKINKSINYIIVFCLGNCFLTYIPYSSYSQLNFRSRFVSSAFILFVLLVVIYDLKKTILPFIKSEVHEIKQSKSMLKEGMLRLIVLSTVALPILGSWAFIIISLQKQYLFTETNELIIYANNEKYIVVTGEYDESKNEYIYDYGKYKIISKDNITVSSHKFHKIEKNNKMIIVE